MVRADRGRILGNLGIREERCRILPSRLPALESNEDRERFLGPCSRESS